MQTILAVFKKMYHFISLIKPASFQLGVIGQLKALTNLDGVLTANEEAAEALQYLAGSKMTEV